MNFIDAILNLAAVLLWLQWRSLRTSKPTAPIKSFIALLQPTDKIFMDGEYANASSVRFYTGQQIYVLNGRVNGLWYGSLFPDSPPIFFGDAQFAKVWGGSSRIYLITRNEKNREILAPVAPVYLITKSADRYVFSNRP